MSQRYSHPTVSSYDGGETSVRNEVDYDKFIKDILLWTNKFRSGFYFVVGWLLLYLAVCVATSEITIFTGLCYLLLGSLTFNFLRALASPRLAERCLWTNSSAAAAAKSVFDTTVNAATALHDAHLNGRDPLKTLEAAVLLWLLSLLGRHLSALTLLALCHLSVFTLPVLHLRYRGTLDALFIDLFGKVKTKCDALDRRVKASGIFVALLIAAMLLPAGDKVAAGVIFFAYGRCILKPNELSKVQRGAAPVGDKLASVGDAALEMAVSAANKYELTPTPLKRRKAD